ncbi:MAG TPA: CHAP domain-containing protein [Candidatus Angelobacter sp.]|nr:CHAP domain-containing protein [Candidatus Angelobacter sp.]
MKLHTIKSVLTTLSSKILLVFLLVLIIVGVQLQMAQKTSADQYDDKIAALQQDIARYQAEGIRLNNEAATLQSALAQLANQKVAIQAEIDLSQAKHDQLVIDIADTEKKIKDNQDALGVTIANLYVEADISPLEMLASSKNISDYLDKQEYRNSVRDELAATILNVKDLKKTLDAQKAEVAKTLEDQKMQQGILIAKESEQKNLLDRTKGEEAGYQQLIGDSQAQIAEAKATQAIINARINQTGGGTVINGGLLPDYTWNDINCPMLGYYSTIGSDGNGSDGYGYGCRQCASYVAWRIAKETNFYPSWGNAVDFTANAQSRFGVGDGQPRADSIAVMDPGKAGQSFGHVAWVETDPYTKNDGRTVIQVSQYNYDYGQGYGMYSLMELSVDAFDHYVQVVK